MKSLLYVMSGRARTFDDCLDRARQEPVLAVWVRLKTKDDTTQTRIVQHLCADYTWLFRTEAVCVEKIHGGLLGEDSRDAASRAEAAANRDLLRTLARLREAGLEVYAKDTFFRPSPQSRLAAPNVHPAAD
ncbi:MAG: hypothetical protein JXR37_29140 [Kiritimatiellae bacterium]|nr:hypothetical protein [Kiritimatiellia bacterium]